MEEPLPIVGPEPPTNDVVVDEPSNDNDEITIENGYGPYLEDETNYMEDDDMEGTLVEGEVMKLEEAFDSEDTDGDMGLESNDMVRYGSNSYHSDNEENLQNEFDKIEQNYREGSTKTYQSLRSTKSVKSGKSIKSTKSLKSMNSSHSLQSQHPDNESVAETRSIKSHQSIGLIDDEYDDNIVEETRNKKHENVHIQNNASYENFERNTTELENIQKVEENNEFDDKTDDHNDQENTKIDESNDDDKVLNLM